MKRGTMTRPSRETATRVPCALWIIVLVAVGVAVALHAVALHVVAAAHIYAYT